MRKLILIFFAIAMVAGFSNKVMAQNDTKANQAVAHILGAINLTVGDPLEFGSIIPGTGGTVKVDTSGVRTFTGGTSGVAVTVTPTAASYTVGGTGLLPYTIEIPTSDVTITNTTGGGNETMTVSNMICTGTTTHTFNASGADAFTVGGTLNVGNGQEPGNYTGSFNVTVHY